MKKIALSLAISLTLCYSNFIFSNTIEKVNPDPYWSGFYFGANSGYWWAQTNKVDSTGSTSYINQTFASGAINVTTALTQIATNDFSLHPYGFIGGGQVGYNYQYNKEFLLGLDIDFDGLTNSNKSSSSQKSVNLVDFNENYVGSLSVTQKINYLGTVRARLGYLYHPTFLIYATGGFAYGNVTFDTAWTAQESLGPIAFPTIYAKNSLNKILPGWTIGAGIEWLFKPNWSTKLEYTYYDLNDLNSSVTLSQMNGSTSPPALWGRVNADTDLSIAAGTIRASIIYHFPNFMPPDKV